MNDLNSSQTFAAPLFAAALLLTGAGSVLADVRYVDVNSASPTPPYTNWTNAATNIQNAADAAGAGDEIVVTNGIYATGGRTIDGITTNRVAVDKSVSLRSVNGPQFTTIDGGHSGRCVYLPNGASLSGFTLTNGAAGRGGGVFCESTNALVSNCVLTHNLATFGGGASGCTLNNCTLSGNSAEDGGGAGSSTLNNCALSNNSATSTVCCAGGNGGGANICTLNNCTLNDNVAWGDRLSGTGYSGGGGAYGSTLNNCTLTGNQAIGNFRNANGGGAFRCTLNNCVVYSNTAYGLGGGSADSTLNNCTVSGNSAGVVGGASGGTLNNCIVYSNTVSPGTSYDNYNPFNTIINHSCTTPLPTNGFGNITNAPLFVDLGSGNLRLQSNSPCINAGNNSYVTNTTDLDGNRRIAGVTVDMGAYEFQPAWIAPPLTILRSGENLVLTWPANYAGFDYTGYILESTTNLVSPAVWTQAFPRSLVANGQHAVTNLISSIQKFYRLHYSDCEAVAGPWRGGHWVIDLSSCEWVYMDGPGGGD